MDIFEKNLFEQNQKPALFEINLDMIFTVIFLLKIFELITLPWLLVFSPIIIKFVIFCIHFSLYSRKDKDQNDGEQ